MADVYYEQYNESFAVTPKGTKHVISFIEESEVDEFKSTLNETYMCGSTKENFAGANKPMVISTNGIHILEVQSQSGGIATQAIVLTAIALATIYVLYRCCARCCPCCRMPTVCEICKCMLACATCDNCRICRNCSRQSTSQHQTTPGTPVQAVAPTTRQTRTTGTATTPPTARQREQGTPAETSSSDNPTPLPPRPTRAIYDRQTGETVVTITPVNPLTISTGPISQVDGAVPSTPDTSSATPQTTPTPSLATTTSTSDFTYQQPHRHFHPHPHGPHLHGQHQVVQQVQYYQPPAWRHTAGPAEISTATSAQAQQQAAALISGVQPIPISPLVVMPGTPGTVMEVSVSLLARHPMVDDLYYRVAHDANYQRMTPQQRTCYNNWAHYVNRAAASDKTNRQFQRLLRSIIRQTNTFVAQAGFVPAPDPWSPPPSPPPSYATIHIPQQQQHPGPPPRHPTPYPTQEQAPPAAAPTPAQGHGLEAQEELSSSPSTMSNVSDLEVEVTVGEDAFNEDDREEEEEEEIPDPTNQGAVLTIQFPPEEFMEVEQRDPLLQHPEGEQPIHQHPLQPQTQQPPQQQPQQPPQPQLPQPQQPPQQDPHGMPEHGTRTRRRTRYRQ